MGRIRHRNPVEVREKALETAAKKYDEGCLNCSASYLEVAKKNGATEKHIAHFGMDRRGFLKFAGAVFAAGAAAATGGFVIPRIAHAMASTPFGGMGFFGVDSCTSLANAMGASMPLQFYIAEVGAGAYGLDCFDPATAAQVGPDFTHGYWGLSGPAGGDSSVPTPTDPYEYGKQQALAALQAISQLPGIGGHTLFADVEYGFGGWDGTTPDQNVALLNGFLETIASAQYVPGVYISNYCRDNWFPADYAPKVPFVYWLAGGELAGTMCAPCDPTCDTLTPVRDGWIATVQHASFGGQRAAIWQYWLSDSGCSGDYNFSMQAGYQTFAPVPVGSPLTPANTPTTAPTTTPETTPTTTPTTTP